jgi:succinoglycan biosynthesis protein ExoA
MPVKTRISIISPCRNERDYIAGFVASLLAQELPESCTLEVLIADGLSDDGTREILDALAARHPTLRVVSNPGRIVSKALNAAIREATGDVIVRMDAHTTYAPDYVRACVETLERTGADNVGGPWRAAGESYLQKAIALVSHSPFASGGGRSHALDYEGEVDTVYLGCWRKAIFERVGLFDEELVRNQDDELNLRIVRAGGRVWQSPRIRSTYAPRSSLANLFSQYKQYGYWKVRVIQKHTLPASIRHVVPGAFAFMLLALAALSLIWAPARAGLGLLLAAYAAANLIASVHTCITAGTFRYLPVIPIVFAGYHVGYGWGFLRGVVDFLLLRRRGSGAAFTGITRGSSRGA